MAARRKSPKMTAKRRRSLGRKSFAIPARKGAKTATGKKKTGRYPIDTLGRARNALARVSQHGAAKEKGQVARAVRRKYPSLKNSAFVKKHA